MPRPAFRIALVAALLSLLSVCSPALGHGLRGHRRCPPPSPPSCREAGVFGYNVYCCDGTTLHLLGYAATWADVTTLCQTGCSGPGQSCYYSSPFLNYDGADCSRYRAVMGAGKPPCSCP
jgi:hypothetical protein